MPAIRLRKTTADPAIMALQTRADYRVLSRQDGWIICYAGREYGPYASPREAMFFAIEAAHNMGERGFAAQVRLVETGGDTQASWTYGVDTYPPLL